MESMTDQSGIRSGDGDAFDTGDWKPADGGQWRPAAAPVPSACTCPLGGTVNPKCPVHACDCTNYPCTCGGPTEQPEPIAADDPEPINLAFELGRATGMIRDALTYGWAGCAREDAQAWLDRIDAWATGSGETL